MYVCSAKSTSLELHISFVDFVVIIFTQQQPAWWTSTDGTCIEWHNPDWMLSWPDNKLLSELSMCGVKAGA